MTSELADVLAYLDQRRDNCAVMAASDHGFAETARERQRQIEVIIGDLRAGLHEGLAAARAATAPYPFTGHRTLEQVPADEIAGDMA